MIGIFEKIAGTLKCNAPWFAALTLVVCVPYISLTNSSWITGTSWSVAQEKPASSVDQLNPDLIKNPGKLLKKKVIVFATNYWSKLELNWERVFSTLLKRECPINDCSLSYEWANASSADAIVYYAVNIISKLQLPENRSRSQVFVYFSDEAPTILDTTADAYNRMKDVFNWTMTFRSDSDVYMPYGQVLISEKPDAGREPNPWREKQKILRATPSRPLACWMVSHCLTASRREDYVHELQKHLPVDIYGECGPLSCGSRQTISTIRDGKDECIGIIELYHFYLSFENALCRDYVTEKFYKALDMNIVPVVFGSANYTAIAPPNSFIRALDFGSPKQLASYLKLVASNENLYNSFFEWKKHYSVQLGHPHRSMVCDLCAKLHGSKSSVYHKRVPQLSNLERSPQRTRPPHPPSNQPVAYSDIKKWFVDDSHCQTWTLKGLIPYTNTVEQANDSFRYRENKDSA